jgi:hypothetical protein
MSDSLDFFSMKIYIMWANIMVHARREIRIYNIFLISVRNDKVSKAFAAICSWNFSIVRNKVDRGQESPGFPFDPSYPSKKIRWFLPLFGEQSESKHQISLSSVGFFKDFVLVLYLTFQAASSSRVYQKSVCDSELLCFEIKNYNSVHREDETSGENRRNPQVIHRLLHARK